MEMGNEIKWNEWNGNECKWNEVNTIEIKSK